MQACYERMHVFLVDGLDSNDAMRCAETPNIQFDPLHRQQSPTPLIMS